MDKICRGSLIGEVYGRGYRVAGCTDSSKNRGTQISHRWPKLETQVHSRGSTNRATSDTFRSQAWFRHDIPDPQNGRIPYLSPRFWKDAKGHSPAPPSEKPRVERMGSGRHSPRRPSCDYLTEKVQSARGSLFDGVDRGGSRRSPRLSPRSPREDVARGRSSPREAWNEGGAEQANASSSAKPRSPSPTYRDSENWMAYSGQQREGEPREAMTELAANWKSGKRRPHAGRQTELSDNFQKGLTGVRSEPIITNSVNFVSCGGIRTHIRTDKDEGENLRRRLQLDPTQAVTRRSERRHNSPEQYPPNAYRIMHPSHSFSPSPRSPREDSMREVSRSTVPRMSGSSSATSTRSGIPAINGFGDAANSGRRHAPACIEHFARQVSDGASAPVSFRDQVNSDMVRDNLQPCVSALGGTAGLPRSTGAAAPPPRVASSGAAGNTYASMYCYGDISCLPSNVSKDTAYLHSGLKMAKIGPRSPGAFSPNKVRIPHRQAVVFQPMMQP